MGPTARGRIRAAPSIGMKLVVGVAWRDALRAVKIGGGCPPTSYALGAVSPCN